MGVVNAKVAVVICNWNKKDDILKCIASVLDQDYQELDTYVVDNASSDGSAEAIAQAYPEVTVIVNEENLGGSGGFNTGLRAALTKDYHYIWLLDNDVVADRQALSKLVHFLSGNEDAGMAGSKLYYMSQPDLVQEFGAWIDWDNAYIKPNKKYHSEARDGEITENAEVDYVPACSVLVRTDAVRKCGLMNESNFLYWDDMEWGFKFKQNRYKVYAVADSKVWHNMGTANKRNLLPTYYFWRNRIRFFKKYGNAKTFDALMEDLFTAQFTCSVFQKDNTRKVIEKAMLDGLNDRGGPIAGAGSNDLDIDRPRKYLDDYPEEEKKRLRYLDLDHVIANAPFEDAGDRFLIYRDKYHNLLPSGVAFGFQGEYRSQKADFLSGIKERLRA